MPKWDQLERGVSSTLSSAMRAIFISAPPLPRPTPASQPTCRSSCSFQPASGPALQARALRRSGLLGSLWVLVRPRAGVAPRAVAFTPFSLPPLPPIRTSHTCRHAALHPFATECGGLGQARRAGLAGRGWPGGVGRAAEGGSQCLAASARYETCPELPLAEPQCGAHGAMPAALKARRPKS